MPEPLLLDWPTWAQWTVGAAAVLAALKVIGSNVKTASAWLGGIVRREVTDIVDAKLVPVLAELYPNGGSSLRDRVDMTHQLLVEHIAEEVEARRMSDSKIDRVTDEQRRLADNEEAT